MVLWLDFSGDWSWWVVVWSFWLWSLDCDRCGFLSGSGSDSVVLCVVTSPWKRAKTVRSGSVIAVPAAGGRYGPWEDGPKNCSRLRAALDYVYNSLQSEYSDIVTKYPDAEQQRRIGWATASHWRESSYSRLYTACKRFLRASFGPSCNQVCNTRRILELTRRQMPRPIPPANSRNRGAEREINPPRMAFSKNQQKCQQRQRTLKHFEPSPHETSTPHWEVRTWILSQHTGGRRRSWPGGSCKFHRQTTSDCVNLRRKPN
jgi:hypothetical protein